MNTDFICERRLAKLNPTYSKLVKNTAFVLSNALEKYKMYFPDYTDHTILHSMQVLDFCNRLIAETCEQLNEDELYVLIMSAYLHDCGMGISDADYRKLADSVVSADYRLDHPNDNVCETIRSFHQSFSKKLIYKYAPLFDIPSEEHTRAIALVSEGHRRTNLYSEDMLPAVLKMPNGNEVHLPYLTSLIRLADELDIACDRNLGIGMAGHDNIFRLMHRCIKHLHITPEKFVLDVEADDPAIFYDISKEIVKLDETFRLCADVIEKRTPFRLTQQSVEINRIAGNKKNVLVLDTDLGTDDACALLLLKTLPVKPDYIVASYGNTSLDGACRSAVLLKKYLDLDCTIVKGLPAPVDPSLPLEEKSTFHGNDGLAGCSDEIAEKLRLTEEDFADYISFDDLRARLTNADSLTYITIGTPTNLASLLESEEMRKKVSGIYIMGGGVNEFNCSHDTEFNFSKHPESARFLLSLGLNLTLFPLDVTNHQYLTDAEIDTLAAIGTYPEYIRFLRYNRQSNAAFNNIEGAVLHDALPVLYLSHPDRFVLEDKRVSVDKYGRTSLSGEGRTIHVCTSVDMKLLFESVERAFCS